jgi:hypothetical protein
VIEQMAASSCDVSTRGYDVQSTNFGVRHEKYVERACGAAAAEGRRPCSHLKLKELREYILLINTVKKRTNNVGLDVKK